MSELVSTIIIVILLLVVLLYYESKYSELTYVTSTIDGEQYMVRNREDKLEAANLLATIKMNLFKIVAYFKLIFHPIPPGDFL